MCHKCDDLDARIRRYRTFAASGMDKLTIERITELVHDLSERKDLCDDVAAAPDLQ